CHLHPPQTRMPLFPYTTLFRSQARAVVGAARISLSYATVTAPIAGRAGQQGVTEGALVGQGTPTLLTTVEQIDPIYVNFDQPAVDRKSTRLNSSHQIISYAVFC